MSRHVIICVNGILTNPGDSDGWTDRAVTWLHLHTEAHAEKFEYAAGIFTRRLQQHVRAWAIARMAKFYFEAGWSVSLLGHSNGCDLIARVLDLTRSRCFRSVHLFAAAADGRDFYDALGRQQIGRVFLYGSENDRALKLAALSRKLFGWLGLGYGSFGLRVKWVTFVDTGFTAVNDNSQTHSSWFARGHAFERTMRLIRRHEFPLLAELPAYLGGGRTSPADAPQS